VRLWIIITAINVMKHYGILALDLEVHVYKEGHFFHGLISFHNTSCSASVKVTFGKLGAAKSVTFSNQCRAGLNVLTVENWKSY
jgi:hypothetical protein